MKPPKRHYSTGEIMLMTDEARDQLEESGELPAHRIMAAKFHLAANMPNRTVREYQKLKAKAAAAAAEKEKSQSDLSGLQEQVDRAEGELSGS